MSTTSKPPADKAAWRARNRQAALPSLCSIARPDRGRKPPICTSARCRCRGVVGRDASRRMGSVFGLHHLGFWVENEDETRRRLKEAGAEYNFTVDRPDFYEEKYKGPDAVMIDISGRSWV